MGLAAGQPGEGDERYQEEKRDRWLSNDELRRLCDVLDRHPNQRAANAVRLQLLTGARLGEVLPARKDAFVFERGVWIKPAHHTKQKRTEHVPLSGQALLLLAAILEASDPETPYLFPGNVPGQPLKGIKTFWASALRQAGIENYRRHDNRHTYASHLVSSGLSLELVGRLLGHTTATTTKRYAHLADDPLRAATERFGAKIAALRTRSEAEIVPLSREHRSFVGSRDAGRTSQPPRANELCERSGVNAQAGLGDLDHLPEWDDRAPIFGQPMFPTLVVRDYPLHSTPKFCGMAGLVQMYELMHQDVVDDWRREEDLGPVQVQVAPRSARAPAKTEVLNSDVTGCSPDPWDPAPNAVFQPIPASRGVPVHEVRPRTIQSVAIEVEAAIREL